MVFFEFSGLCPEPRKLFEKSLTKTLTFEKLFYRAKIFFQKKFAHEKVNFIIKVLRGFGGTFSKVPPKNIC